MGSDSILTEPRLRGDSGVSAGLRTPVPSSPSSVSRCLSVDLIHRDLREAPGGVGLQMCVLCRHLRLQPRRRSPRPIPGAPGGLWASVQPPGPRFSSPPAHKRPCRPRPATPRPWQCSGPCLSVASCVRSGSFALGAALAQTPLPVRASQTAGPEPRRGADKCGADVCGEAAAAPHGGRWRTPVSPACVHSPPRPVRVEEKQLDSEVPQDTRRLPGRTAALSSRPGACHRHPGSRALVASLPEASPLSETFCIPLGLLKISF